MSGSYLVYCVLCPSVPVAAPGLDFCKECLAEDKDECNFGRCYLCRGNDHSICLGVPCQCPCPGPDQIAEDMIRDAALAKLTPEERRVLGV